MGQDKFAPFTHKRAHDAQPAFQLTARAAGHPTRIDPFRDFDPV